MHESRIPIITARPHGSELRGLRPRIHGTPGAAQKGAEVQAAHRLPLNPRRPCRQQEKRAGVIYNTPQFGFDFCLSVDVIVVHQLRLTQR
jgi:hypothetical protein